MQDCLYLTANEVKELLGISRAKAYKIIKVVNQELEAKGYIVIAGRIPRKFFAEKYYGFADSLT